MAFSGARPGALLSFYMASADFHSTPPAPGAASHESFVDVQYRAGYHGSFT